MAIQNNRTIQRKITSNMTDLVNAKFGEDAKDDPGFPFNAQVLRDMAQRYDQNPQGVSNDEYKIMVALKNMAVSDQRLANDQTSQSRNQMRHDEFNSRYSDYLVNMGDRPAVQPLSNEEMKVLKTAPPLPPELPQQVAPPLPPEPVAPPLPEGPPPEVPARHQAAVQPEIPNNRPLTAAQKMANELDNLADLNVPLPEEAKSAPSFGQRVDAIQAQATVLFQNAADDLKATQSAVDSVLDNISVNRNADVDPAATRVDQVKAQLAAAEKRLGDLQEAMMTSMSGDEKKELASLLKAAAPPTGLNSMDMQQATDLYAVDRQERLLQAAATAFAEVQQLQKNLQAAYQDAGIVPLQVERVQAAEAAPAQEAAPRRAREKLPENDGPFDENDLARTSNKDIGDPDADYQVNPALNGVREIRVVQDDAQEVSTATEN